MKESRVVRARSRLRCGDGNYFYEPALGFLTSLGLLCPGLDQKVVPEALFAAPFRKKAPHPWAYAQGGFIPSVTVVLPAAEPAGSYSILFFHTGLKFDGFVKSPWNYSSSTI
jgi:hypothetical protein